MPPAPEQAVSAVGEDRSDTDDALLVVRAAEGDEEAFAVLVRLHAPTLVRMATRMLGNEPEAEDAVQDALISAWRKLPQFQMQSTFRTWVYRIVTNRCLNVLRSRRPVDHLDAADHLAAPEHTVSPARIAESHAAVDELQTALTTLSAEQRACWVLRELDGQSYEFIAQAVGISQEAVRARVFRARRSLTQQLGAWR
ncbi:MULTISPECIES: RNA polymerase sigma factor [Streptomyces]|uniref:Sigma-70 family RNA polymerase sigma factor n=1 Tax=Streptomyces glycanivorans TaxID=3033808 RepID=A0ABY9JJT8_9ACTN|nr:MULTISPECIES: sigma-70 family RNA polymerase sigma factor [unclassified Streptomyces]WSQ81330.1 sigma-70 family RNA polymerase sigma factor [Streptomyces sp. NBC_01213]TXS10615.1 sigma-70 family RNA polymerase sigma factor [Streptomyces sp. wa22]WLQ67985.1 sigma-70 family RNA polymerase sigma factor [Streptomyces sp. Alt3]WSQ88660.1 sigma-70 family RNA polymerase sigma factor [Streptomyces sp. NBC_01212]WSR05333.1 sigma-70 family RNA polymerase sigma factor [Streptomyces sp. NBC_01208]